MHQPVSQYAAQTIKDGEKVICRPEGWFLEFTTGHSFTFKIQLKRVNFLLCEGCSLQLFFSLPPKNGRSF